MGTGAGSGLTSSVTGGVDVTERTIPAPKEIDFGTGDSNGEAEAGEAMTTTTTTQTIEQTGWTSAVPSEYFSDASEQGSVEALTYYTKNYAWDGSNIRKTTYVYLPYGYDEKDTETRYNILYLMHGWGGHAGEYFEYGAKNLLDNLIEKGDIPPIIVASASFYNESSTGDFSSSITEFRAFHNEFEKDMMPAVEENYHTFAKSASDEDLSVFVFQ